MKRRDFLFGAAGSLLLALAGCAKRKWGPADTRYAVLDDVAARRDIDVCIIGSGPAGSALAMDLLGAGKRVVILESGSPPGDSLGAMRAMKLDAYETFGLDYPLADTRVRAVAGTTAVWTGRTPRMLCPPISNRTHSRRPGIPGRSGTKSPAILPPRGTHAARGGRAAQQGAGAARRRSARSAAHRHRRNAGRCPARRLTVDFPPFAHALDPESREPIRFARDVLPALSQEPDLALVSGATVTGFTMDPSGRTGAAHASRTYAGNQHELHARSFVIACGAVESARLWMNNAKLR